MALKILSDLRGRYFRCKGNRWLIDIEKEIGVSRAVLARFGRDGFVSMASLERIEQWVELEEMRLADEGSNNVRRATQS